MTLVIEKQCGVATIAVYFQSKVARSIFMQLETVFETTVLVMI